MQKLTRTQAIDTERRLHALGYHSARWQGVGGYFYVDVQGKMHREDFLETVEEVKEFMTEVGKSWPNSPEKDNT